MLQLTPVYLFSDEPNLVKENCSCKRALNLSGIERVFRWSRPGPTTTTRDGKRLKISVLRTVDLRSYGVSVSI